MTVEQRRMVIDCLVTLALLVVVTVVCKATGKFFNITDVAMLYLLPIIYAGARTNIWVSVTTAIAGVLLFDLLFVPPLYTFTVSDAHYVVTFAIFLLVGITTSVISHRLKNKTKETEAALGQTSAMYDLSTDLTAVSHVDEFSRIIVSGVADAVGSDAVLYQPDRKYTLTLTGASDPQGRLATDKNEGGVATWVFENGREAGPGTDTLPGAKGIYVPLVLEDEILGVLGIDVSEETDDGLVKKKALLLSFAGLATLALNKLLLTMAAQHVLNLEESERLRTALFNSVSHELRTPLASMMGAATSLQDSEELYSPEQRADLLKTIEEGASRMNRVVQNLLDMTRLESGTFKLNEDWCDVQDIIGVAVADFPEELQSRWLDIDVQQDLPLIKADFELLVQVLVNILDNAIKYSSQGTDIQITASCDEAAVLLGVGDRGPGILRQDRERVFEKFYRLRTAHPVSGTGLGLSICMAIVEAHGGSISVDDRPGGGSMFTISLPVERLDTAGLMSESEMP
jgi:two-component system, OmpR family, sensor histidine kinase KdpD